MDTHHDAHAEASNLSRLLIAEDHALVRKGLRAMLADEPDLEVVGEAENGRRAVEMSGYLVPDLVLMDVRMPEMDGLEATKRIKKAQPEVSVLILTTHQSPDYLLEAVRSGAAGYILKDSSHAELLDAVRNTLSGESILNQNLAMKLIVRIAEEPGLGLERPSKQNPGEQHIPKALAGILSSRELETLRLIAAGKTNREIARELMVSHSTVKTYVQRIIKKLGVSDRTHASVKALEMGLLPSRSD